MSLLKNSPTKSTRLYFLLGAFLFVAILFGGISLSISNNPLEQWMESLIVPAIMLFIVIPFNINPEKGEEITTKIVASAKTASLMNAISCLFLFTIITFSTLMISVSVYYHFNH